MITIILFIISAVITINFIISMIGAIFGHGISTPCPLFHLWAITYANTYISFFGLGYQIYFWGMHFGII